MRVNTLLMQARGRDAWTRPEIESFAASAVDCIDGLTTQYRLPLAFPVVPAAAVEMRNLYLRILKPEFDRVISTRCRLRLHSANQYRDYSFELSVVIERDPLLDVPHRPKDRA